MRQYLCSALLSAEFSLLVGITPSEAGKRRAVEDHRPKTAFTCSRVSTLLGLGLSHRLRHNDLEGLSKNQNC